MPWLKSTQFFYESAFNGIFSSATFFVRKSYHHLTPGINHPNHKDAQDNGLLWFGASIVTAPFTITLGLSACLVVGFTAIPALAIAVSHDYNKKVEPN